MSEGNRLSYRIEFEADEESLVDAIGDAIISSKPAISYMLQEVVTESLKDSVKEAAKGIGPIRFEVETASEYRREVPRTREEPAGDDTVGGLMKKTADVISQADPEDVSPVISSAIGMLVSQVTSYLRDNPASASRILESPASSVIVQESRYGDFSEVLRSLKDMLYRIESRGGLGEFYSIPASIKDDLISIMGREKGMEVVSRDLMNDADIVQRMSIGRLMDTMGITPDPDDDIGDIVRTEVAVALSREGRVTIAQYEPIVEREEQEKFNRVVEFLEKTITPHLTGLISASRARLGEEFDINIGRVVDSVLKAYGGLVSDDVGGVTEIGQEAMPDSGFEFRDEPRDESPRAIDTGSLVEAFNRIADALLRIGEREAARQVEEASNIITDAIKYAKSGDLGG